MGIKGFQGTSLLDFPGRIASLVFWGGCNLTCPFCHNPALVLDPESYPDLNTEVLLQALADRKKFIDGVVVSGGEPTLYPELLPFLKQVKALGLLVKLDTNGLLPNVVERLLAEGLVDYLAVDLKTTPERYPGLHSAAVDHAALLNTVRLGLDSEIEVEFRTTCVPGWVDEEVVHALGQMVEGAPLWAIQQYHAEYALAETARELTPFSSEQVNVLAAVAQNYVEQVVVRGL